MKLFKVILGVIVVTSCVHYLDGAQPPTETSARSAIASTPRNDDSGTSRDTVSSSILPAETDSGFKYWVASNRLNRRTCPSTTCGIVGALFFREAATVYEQEGGWVRISNYYTASCVNGRSEYVDSGNNRCAPDNGIVDGRFAEWVSAAFLAQIRPPDPAIGATGIDALIANSDDYRIHKAAFVKAAQSLISSGQCSEADLGEYGGWVKSSNRRDQPIYFTYCGGSTLANRVYLNAEQGKIFR